MDKRGLGSPADAANESLSRHVAVAAAASENACEGSAANKLEVSYEMSENSGRVVRDGLNAANVAGVDWDMEWTAAESSSNEK